MKTIEQFIAISTVVGLLGASAIPVFAQGEEPGPREYVDWYEPMTGTRVHLDSWPCSDCATGVIFDVNPGGECLSRGVGVRGAITLPDGIHVRAEVMIGTALQFPEFLRQ